MRRGPRFINELAVACIGDSQTAANFSAGLGMEYPEIVAQRKGYGFWLNRGIGGNTTTEMLARFSAQILTGRPGAVSIMGGPNDISQGIAATGVGSTKENYRSMIQAAQATGARVTVLTYVPVRAQAYIDAAPARLAAIQAVATEEGAEFLDVYGAFAALVGGNVLPPNLDQYYLPGDTHHPNEVGHNFIASLVASNPNAWAQP